MFQKASQKLGFLKKEMPIGENIFVLKMLAFLKKNIFSHDIQWISWERIKFLNFLMLGNAIKVGCS